MTSTLGALGLLVSAAVLAGCGSTPSQAAGAAKSTAAATNPTASTKSGPAGSLTVYAALTAANGKALTKAFEAYDPNAHVAMITAGTGALITRINAEHQAGALKADVLILADPTVMPSLQQEGILATYKPPAAAKLPSSLQGTDWVGAFTFHNVIIYHKGMSLPVPHSWTDLTKSTYAGHIELGDPAYSGTTLGMVGYLSGHYGWRYFQSLRKNQATVVSSTNTVGTDVAAGRVDVGISLDSVANSLIAKGSPVGEIWPSDGAIPVPAPASIVAGKANSLSEAFVNWLLSSAGQHVVSQTGLAPVSGSSPLVPQNAKMVNVNWAKVAADRSTILSQFNTVLK